MCEDECASPEDEEEEDMHGDTRANLRAHTRCNAKGEEGGGKEASVSQGGRFAVTASMINSALKKLARLSTCSQGLHDISHLVVAGTR